MALLQKNNIYTFCRRYPYTSQCETPRSHLARTILFHIRNKITVYPDSVRFVLLSRGSFFVCFMEGVAKRLGGGGEIIEEKQGRILAFSNPTITKSIFYIKTYSFFVLNKNTSYDIIHPYDKRSYSNLISHTECRQGCKVIFHRLWR